MFNLIKRVPMKKLCILATAFALGTGALYAQPTTVRLTKPNGGEQFRAGTSQPLSWDTTGTFRSRFRFQFGTTPTGPWTDLVGATNVLDSGSTRGTFSGGFRVPSVETTTGYVRMVLLNSDGTLNEGVTDASDAPFQVIRPQRAPVDSLLKTPITSQVTLSRNKIYGLDGYLFVDNGGLLRIEPGTIIVGDTVGQNSAICVNRGGKIYAKGTAQAPIVMTSSAPPGQRAGGDWGGVLMCGRARTNHPGGEAALEGGIADQDKVRGWFGGNDDDDSSGVMEYVRIEFAGIAAAPNQELNSLTMGAVGRKTVLNHIQVSYANDDAYEWFGGTVNAKHLIAIGTLDDDFDGDNGWSGRVQFALSQRFRQTADQSTSQTFEMDNNSQGGTNEPLTKPIFSNVTSIGPIQDITWTAGSGANQYNAKFGATMQIRRNARTSIFNSVFLGWPRGIEIANVPTMEAALAEDLQVRNCNWYGIKGTWLNLAGGTPPTGLDENWIATAKFGNVLSANSPNDAQIENPFAFNAQFNPMPKPDAPYLANADYTKVGPVAIDDSFFEKVPYRGAFGTKRWDAGWANYDPINTNYIAGGPTTGNGTIRITKPNGGEELIAGSKQTIEWDTTGTEGLSFRFQYGTSPNGPWTTVQGAENVLDGGSTHGKFEGGFTVPTELTQNGYLRMVLLKSDNTVNDAVADVIDAAFKIVAEPDPVIRLIKPNGGEEFRAGTSQDLQWDTTGTYRSRFRFQFGTSATGPWTDLAGATNVLDSGSTRGKFTGGFRVPSVETNSGYLRIVKLNTDGTPNESLADVSDAAFTVLRPAASKADSVLHDPVTSQVTLSNTKIYSLDGYVFVDDGGVLRIQEGTIIIGDTVGQNSAICVNRGGKIYAKGTPQLPIVFTSSAAPNQRAGGDWGGLLLCGRGVTNHPGGEAALEGGIADQNKVRGWFGGNDNDDSSGVLEYVRIEFAGIAAAPNQELNSLTMGGVGRKTVLDHIQVSYANDDAYEWFGGAVNARHLIAVGTLDDDFDGDNGWSGKVQFAIAQRWAKRADVSTSEHFEMDNNAQGGTNEPLTAPIFSNVTGIGPIQDMSWTAGNGENQYNAKFGAAMQIRRNARTSIFNSVIVGWPRGIEIANVPTMEAALANAFEIRNNSWYGVKGTWLNLAGGTPPTGLTDTWIATESFSNVLMAESPTSAELENPFAVGVTFNPAAKSSAPHLDNASFAATGSVAINDPFFEQVSYRGAMGMNRWDAGWTEYDPQSKTYEAQQPTGVNDGGNAVTGFSLKAFPNPTNDLTKVSYSLEAPSDVTIRVFDALGTLSATLIAGQQQGAGVYEFNLTTADLAAGVYYVQVSTARGTATQMITVVR